MRHMHGQDNGEVNCFTVLGSGTRSVSNSNERKTRGTALSAGGFIRLEFENI